MNEGSRSVRGVDLSAVHLDELPAYSGPGHASQPPAPSEPPVPPTNNRQVSEAGPEPVEPPPCYEEVQSQSVAQELEDRLRRAT